LPKQQHNLTFEEVKSFRDFPRFIHKAVTLKRIQELINLKDKTFWVPTAFVEGTAVLFYYYSLLLSSMHFFERLKQKLYRVSKKKYYLPIKTLNDSLKSISVQSCMTADILDSLSLLINGAFFVTILYPIRGNEDTPHTFSASVLPLACNSINIDFQKLAYG